MKFVRSFSKVVLFSVVATFLCCELSASIKIPQSISFDGGGDYVSCANESIFDFGTGDFTMSAWVKVATDSTSANRTIIGKNIGQQSGGQYPGYRLSNYYGDKLRFTVNNNVNTYYVEGISTLTKGQWHYVTAQRAGTALRIYLNGELYASNETILPTGFNIETNSPFSIGAAIYWSQDNFFKGNIDEVSVYNRALSQSEIAEEMSYGPNLTDSSRVAYYSFDNGNTNDLSGNNHGTLYGDAKFVFGKQKQTRGLSFDGSGDYVSCANESNFDFGTGDFTMLAWVKIATDSTSTNRTIMGKNLGQNAPGAYTGYRLSNFYGDKLRFMVNDGSATYYIEGVSTLTKGQWPHVAAEREGTALRIYLDGELYASNETILPSGANLDNNSPFAIGAAIYWTQGAFFKGDIDEVSVYGRALTKSDIYREMNFAADTTDTTLVACYSFDDGSAVDNSSNNDGTITNAVVSEGIRWQGHDELELACSKLASLNIAALPSSGTITLGGSDSITVSNLANVVLDSADLSIGSHSAYPDDMSEPIQTPYVAANIQPFRLKYFVNEFNYGGYHNFEMFEYALTHGFNVLHTYKSSAADWNHLPGSTIFGGFGGLSYNDYMSDEVLKDGWMTSNGYASGRFDLLPAQSTIATMLLGQNKFAFETGHQTYMIDLESPATPLDFSSLQSQPWYGSGLEDAYYQGFIDAELATIDAAHFQGWSEVGIYGWQPWARGWWDIGLDNEPLRQERWDNYGKYIAAEVDLLYPSVYSFYWDKKNVAYVMHNLDKNIEYANKLPVSKRKPSRTYFWNQLNGGGGGWRWYRELPLKNEDFQAMSAMNCFAGTQGAVLWSWSGTGNHHTPEGDIVAGKTVMAKADFSASKEGGGSGTFHRYDALYILEVTATDVVRFQLINQSVACPWNTDAVWHYDGINNINVLDAPDDENYQYPVYTMAKSSLITYLRPKSEPVSAMVEGLALIKLFEYTLSHGKPCVDIAAATQFSQLLPVVRRVQFGPYHIIATYDPDWENNITPRTVTLSDFAGFSGLNVSIVADNKTRIFVVQTP